MNLNEKLFKLRSKVGKVSKDSGSRHYRTKWIDGYEGRYAVSNFGEIFSVYKNGKVVALRQAKQRDGYHLVRLYKKAQQQDRLVSRIVAEHFIENPNNYKEVNHKDGDKSNNSYSNIEWCTRSQNMTHAIKMGLAKRFGENCGTSKLTESDVLKIRKTYSSGGVSQSEIARDYKVTPSAIYYIVKNKTWKHI